MNRIATLDLIRFFAALSVVFYHYIARPNSTAFEEIQFVAQYGYLGVPVFFMISGYVISLSADNRTPYQFAVSRIIRLYPALWFGVLFTSLVLHLCDGTVTHWTSTVANLTLLNNYVGIENIDQVYWTLQAELKFYICIFLLVAVGLFRHYRIWLTIWLLAATVHSLTEQPFFMGWFITPDYSPYFIAGVLLFLAQKQGIQRYSAGMLSITIALCAYKAYQQASAFIIDASHTDSLVAGSIVVFAILILLAIAREKIIIRGNTLTYSIGALTYPLYLLHNKAGKSLLDANWFSGVGEETKIIIVIIGMLMMSYAVFRLIEIPVSQRLKNVLLPKTVLSAKAQ